jgi:hypothetical protein
LPPCKLDIEFSTFKNEVVKACKRHHGLKDELQALFTELERDYEATKWNKPIPDLGEVRARKIRVGCAKARISPSNGYRLIIQIREVDGQTVGQCLSFYYKPDRGNITASEVLKLIAKAKLAKTEESPSSHTG